MSEYRIKDNYVAENVMLVGENKRLSYENREMKREMSKQKETLESWESNAKISFSLHFVYLFAGFAHGFLLCRILGVFK